MSKFDIVIDELRSKYEMFKKITQKRLDEANELINILISAIKESKLDNDVDIMLFDNIEYNIGFRFRGNKQIGRYIYLVLLSNDNAFPLNINDIGRGKYLAGNFNAYIHYMDTKEVLDTLRKLPDYVKFVNSKLDELIKEFEIVKLEKMKI